MLALVLLVLLSNLLPARANWPCTYPNPCWPSNSDWSSLNHTLQGNLIRARPPAYPCHAPSIDAQACQIAKQNWTNDFWRSQQPGGYFDVAWENGDSYCNIDNDPNVPCAQGLVPYYVAQVKNVADVQAAVNFARTHKLSTRVKGASHDFLGRSSGNGTFGIQTIYLKGITFDNDYKLAGAPHSASGQAVVHVASGEQWAYVYKAANDAGVVVVGGSSYSVGSGGGWILGGGHSSLSPQYGLGVDNVLEFDIVTPDGQLRTVNQYQNTDLFWALRGGGGGFGVLTKVTYKTHPALTSVSYIYLSLNYTEASYPTFLKTFFGLQPTLRAHNFSGYTYPGPTSFTAQLLVHNSADISGMNATLAPIYTFAANETAHGRPVQIGSLARVLPNYFSLFSQAPGTVSEEGVGITSLLGSRLLPLSTFQGSSLDALVNFTAQTPFQVQLLLIAGGKVNEPAADATAIHPSWRHSTHHFIIIGGYQTNTTFAERNTIRRGLTQETQVLGSLVPGAGCYINEADANEASWPAAFWGSNYPRLLAIKGIIDPLGLFTCHHCVGYIG